MLSLFKDQETPVTQEFAFGRAREILISSLNKGLIPSWNDLAQELPLMNADEDLELIKKSFLNLTTWTFLEEVLSSDATEYFFHAPQFCQKLKLHGEKEHFSISLGTEDWQLWLEILSLHFRQNWNVQQPFASFYGELFGKNYRFSLIHASTSPNGVSKLVLRSLASTPFKLESFGQTGLLEEIVKQKKNILIAGSTGSGKTSLLTGLLELVQNEEHLVVLEDTYEILTPHRYQTRFLSGSTAETSLKAYLSYTLRLSPDRIILGEMRSAEAIPFVMAMNTGHKGLMGTIHASSAVDALHRLALLFSLYGSEANLKFETIIELICRNLEYVVFMENKKIKDVIKILGSDRGVPFFETITESPYNLFP